MQPSFVDPARRILNTLADLMPSQRDQAARAGVIPTEWFTWLPLNALALFGAADAFQTPVVPIGPEEPPPARPNFDFIRPLGLAPVEEVLAPPRLDNRLADQLAAIDQIRPDRHSIRVGWLFVAGRRAGPDGRTERVLHPLLSVPVKVMRYGGVGRSALRRAGDVELSSLVEDPQVRSLPIQFGGGSLMDARISAGGLVGRLPKLQTYAAQVAGAAGFETAGLIEAGDSPDELLRRDGLVVVAGVAVYTTHEVGGTGRAATLRAWGDERASTWTAFHSVYLPEARPAGVEVPDAAVESPYVLTPSQREAVRRSRDDAVTVVSGAPGTGKSQTVAAIACDAVSRGLSVLVTAKSEATVDALMELFERAPGPDPVVFGSSERRDALAAKLAGGQLRAAPAPSVEAAHDRSRAAIATRDELRRSVADRLLAESVRTGTWLDPLATQAVAPALFGTADLDAADRLAAAARRADGGWWKRRKARRALQQLRLLAGAASDVPVGTLVEALGAARAVRRGPERTLDGPLDASAQWRALADAEDEVRRTVGEWMGLEAISPARLNEAMLPRLSALGTALRSGREARRTQLARLGKSDITHALPLWVGTLGDIDDLLPPTPAMFDLVILDEASSIDQGLAVPALLRGARAVVVGDPNQLRHVSFLSSTQIDAALTGCGIDPASPLGLRLDVRRNSAFDLGAGVAEVLELDEHFRSAPPLVELVFDRLYAGNVRVATRSPATEAEHCVRTVAVRGGRNHDKVVVAEVDQVMHLLRELHATGADSVAVMSPMRAQADAIEASVLADLTIDVLEDLDLRVGTVHGMQGNERDVVIVSLGVDDEAGSQSWRFVEDPHLLAVMLTRARDRMVLVHAASPSPDGLLAAYLAPGDARLRIAGRGRRRADHAVPWATELAERLRSAGFEVRSPYEVGRHRVDLCIGDHEAFVGVVAGVHPAGPMPHIERQLDLMRAGWRLLEAFPGAWQERRGELVVELAHQADRLGVRVDPPTR